MVEKSMNLKRTIKICSVLIITFVVFISGGRVLAVSSPTILGIVQNYGSTLGGTSVTIIGTNFESGATVDFANVSTQTFSETGASSSWTVPQTPLARLLS